MNKLEVGMYVRTKSQIGKVSNIYERIDDNMVFDMGRYQYYFSEIKKASHNIIDLIEVGDYVNGYLIDYINLTCETPFLRSERPYRVDNTLYSTLKEKGRDYNQPLHFYNEDIKSVLTKEQFSSREYKVGE